MAKILIVDDEPGIIILLEQIFEELEGKGIELYTACNGEQAIKAIKTEKPDIVLLDVMMPGMSGFEVCNTVKNILGVKDIYILMVTAKEQGFERGIGQDAGVDGYITKPFDSDALLNKVANVLGIEM